MKFMGFYGSIEQGLPPAGTSLQMPLAAAMALGQLAPASVRWKVGGRWAESGGRWAQGG